MPGTDPLGNLARAIAALKRERHIPFDVTSLRKNLTDNGLSCVATDLLVAAEADNQCKLLVVIDQYEELLTQTPPDARAQFADTLRKALGGPVQGLVTLRPEFLNAIDEDPNLSDLAFRIRQVRPLESEALRTVIEEPAKVAGLTLEEDLASTLVADTGSGGALPLLAFTLEQLAQGESRGGRLTHQRYIEIGGVQGALHRQADAAMQEACSNTGVTREQVISSLLRLVTIDEQGRPTKRTVALSSFPPETTLGLEPFITRRLLSTEVVGDRTLVAVSHEAFLGNWRPLTDEIDTQIAGLRARRMVESAADDWVASSRDAGALLQGRRLTKAVVDTGAELNLVTKSASSRPPENKRRLRLPRWNRSRQLVTRVDLDEDGREFLKASIRADRAHRHRRLSLIAAAAVILLVTTGFAVFKSFEAQDNAEKATASQLRSEAAALLSQEQPGGDVQAFNELLAAKAIDPDNAADGLLNAAVQRLSTEKIIDIGTPVMDVAVEPTGQHLAAAGGDGKVYFRETGSGRAVEDPVTVPIDGLVRLLSVAFTPTGLRVAGLTEANTVDVWTATGDDRDIRSFYKFSGQVEAAALSADGRYLATGDADGEVQLQDIDEDSLSPKVFHHTDRILAVAVSSDGRRLAASGDNNTVKMWDVATGEETSLSTPNYPRSLAFSPDGFQLATGDADNEVRLWNADTGQPAARTKALIGHTDWVQSLAFSPVGGNRLISGSADRTVRVWNLVVGRPVTIDHREALYEAVMSSDGNRLATIGGDDNSVALWSAESGRALSMTGDTAQTSAVAFSVDGHVLATGTQDGQIRWFDADTGEAKGVARSGHSGRLRSVALSWDGQRMASAGEDGAVLVRNLSENTVVNNFDAADVMSLAFSPDGHRLATGDRKGSVKLWDLDTGDLVSADAAAHSGTVYKIAFDPDGRRLASAGDGEEVLLWDADNGELVSRFSTGHKNWVLGLAFNPDGTRLATSSADRTVRLWDVETGEPLVAPLTGHTRSVSSVAFSVGGDRLASASVDKTVLDMARRGEHKDLVRQALQPNQSNGMARVDLRRLRHRAPTVVLIAIR